MSRTTPQAIGSKRHGMIPMIKGAIELNTIYNEDCLETMGRMPDECVDLILTSPPYDGLRIYRGYSFNFEPIAKELYRVLKPGGVIVWIVGDQTVNGSESGTSFRQALYFMGLGLNLHDTMIYEKHGLTMNHNRYEQDFEYMFVLSNGRPATFNPIKVKTLWPETNRSGRYTKHHDGDVRKAKNYGERKPVKSEKIKGNLWRFNTGHQHSTKDDFAFGHPAIFPEKLAADHIKSWSDEGDTVYDPFMGSGTTAKMARYLNRNYVGSEISNEYCEIAEQRLKQGVLL